MKTLAIAVITRLVSLGSLGLGLLSIGGVLDQLTWRLVLLLGTLPIVLLFLLKHHLCLLVLLCDSVIL